MAPTDIFVRHKDSGQVYLVPTAGETRVGYIINTVAVNSGQRVGNIELEFRNEVLSAKDEIGKILEARENEDEEVIMKILSGKLRFYTNRFCLPGQCCGHKGMFTLLHFSLC